MVTLLVGLAVVAVSAAGFWLVLFSRNPALGPALAETSQGRSPASTENAPSTPIPIGEPIVSRKRRIRSALVLLLATVGTAALIGAALSVVLVVAVLVLI